MAAHNLDDLPALDVPEDNRPVFARRSNKRVLSVAPWERRGRPGGRRRRGAGRRVRVRCAAAMDAEGTSDGEFLVAVALVGFLYGAGDVIPEADAVVERKGEYETAVGGEADVCDAGVVFVDEGAEALACGGIPDSTGWSMLAECSDKPGFFSFGKGS
jgi:hypothetical protein